MDNIIEVDFKNKSREATYTEEDAEMWNYEGFYAGQERLGLNKGYDPNKLYNK